ncbi:MAG TPA: LLM class flavin-dependent oxidoreductase [Methylomirabilota bacterium]|jgi:hypothetical protein|nr:LLM class flavin-dependent oxidoreductase [Methylomirabilota bacterium]
MYHGAPDPAGYLRLDRSWDAGDVVELVMPMEPTLVAPHPAIESTRGVCRDRARSPRPRLEQADQGDTPIAELEIDATAAPTSRLDPSLLEGVEIVRASGFRVDTAPSRGRLYRPLRSEPPRRQRGELTAIAYYAWANRRPARCACGSRGRSSDRRRNSAHPLRHPCHREETRVTDTPDAARTHVADRRRSPRRGAARALGRPPGDGPHGGGRRVDTLFLPDHLLFRKSPPGNVMQVNMPEGKTRGIWESWTTLAAVAEATSRIHLGPLVACTSFRNPAILAKMADRLDEVSDGRLPVAR